MKVTLAYGRTGLEVDLPQDRTVVIEPKHAIAVDDPMVEVRRALRNPVAGLPLREIVKKGSRVAIAICDGTRAQPRKEMIPVVLEELDGIVDPKDIVILVATGTHRGNSDAELEAMLGVDVLNSVSVINHDARDDGQLTFLGNLDTRVPIWLNSSWMAADVRITTGFVEPHFFAGFSGGPKLAAPGLAGLATTLALHDARRIGDPRATWGVIEGNPIHDDIRAIARLSRVDFACDVVLNREQQIVRAFAGELFAMHAAACAHARDSAMAPVDQAFDVVLTSNSGFPLDQNLYQAVKGMSAAAEVVRPGGTIVVAARCNDGFPDHGGYRSLLTSASSPEELYDLIANAPQTLPDQWQVQIQARIQKMANVIMHTDGLSDGELSEAHLGVTHDVQATIEAELDRAGSSAKCCVLPEGPQTIAYVAP